MKKVFKYLLCVLAFILLLLIGVYLSAGFWIKSAVSTLIPQMTKTTASLEKADISLFSGKLAFYGFKIGNPEGFSKNNAFELAEVSVRFQPMSLISEKVVINEIKVSGTKVNAELNRGVDMNLIAITNNIQRYLGKPVNEGTFPTGNAALPQEVKDSSGKALVVQDLQVVNSKLAFTLLNKTTTVSLPNLRQKNIGEKDKVTLPELISDFIGGLTISSMDAITKAGQENLNSVFGFLAQKTKGKPQINDFVKQLPMLF